MTPGIDRYQEIIRHAVIEASTESEGFVEPNYFAAATDVLRSSGSDDEAVSREVFALLEPELGFLRSTAFGVEPSQENWRRLICSIRSLIRELSELDPTADFRFGRLRMLMAVSTYLDRDSCLWQSLPRQVGQNERLLESLAALIASQKFEMRTLLSPAPLATVQALDEFKRADEANDWNTLGELFPRLPPSITGYFAPQAVRCLAQFGFGQLVEASGNITQIAVADMAVRSLTTVSASRLAAETRSNKLKFAALFRLFHGRPEPLTSESRDFVVRMLINASDDDKLWRSWMQVFNRYPVRFPELQTPLGKALAAAHQAAVAQYVDSVWLHNRPHDERKLAGTCLDAFRASAGLERRQTLWTAAKRRWQQWDFEAEDPQASLFEPSWSALDYAVVGFFVECATEAERSELVSSILLEISAIDRRWFRSFTAFLTARNRLLSRLQPIVHAISVINENSQWLAATRQYALTSDQTEYAGKKYWIKAKAPTQSLAEQTQVSLP